MSPTPATGEISTQKLAALFDDAPTAEAAAARLRQELALQPAQVQIVRPGDPRPGRKLEPESRGIWQTLLRTHAVLGVAGLLAGALAFYIFQRSGVRLVTSSPWMSLFAMLFFGAMAGLMLGGLATLRPDHDVYSQRVLEACRDGRYAVVVHAFDAAQRDAARQVLERDARELVASL